MAFRFRRKETVANGFRRIVREQTAAIVSLLADRGNHLEDRVHNARRRIKRLRALLHLVRCAMDDSTFRAQNFALRNAARRLSSARDAEVALTVFECILQKSPRVSWPEFHNLLREEKAGSIRTSVTPARLASVATEVRRVGHAIAETSFSDDGWQLLGPGLEHSLRTTRKCRPRAKVRSPNAALHEWRKRVKRLSLQLELLFRVLAKPERRNARALEKLAAELGDHHDLFMLRARLRKYATKPSANRHRKTLDAEVHRLQGIRLKKIHKLAKQAFSSRPKSFLCSARRSWKAWHKPPR